MKSQTGLLIKYFCFQQIVYLFRAFEFFRHINF